MTNNIINNRKKLCLKFANQIYEMGIYREPNVNNKFVVQFDLFQKRFVKIPFEKIANYIIMNAPFFLNCSDIVDEVITHIPLLPDESGLYNRYVTLKGNYSQGFLNELSDILNSKYYLSKSYTSLDKKEKGYLEQLAKEEVYFISGHYNHVMRNKRSVQSNCFIKHIGDYKFQYISLYDLFGSENIAQFNIREWGEYLPNINKKLLDNYVKYYEFTEFKKDNIELISYVNKEMGI